MNTKLVAMVDVDFDEGDVTKERIIAAIKREIECLDDEPGVERISVVAFDSDDYVIQVFKKDSQQ